MPDGVLAALISLGSAIITAFFSSRLTIYRIDQLEKKVDKHNNLIERTYKIESRLAVNETEQETIREEIKELKIMIKEKSA